MKLHPDLDLEGYDQLDYGHVILLHRKGPPDFSKMGIGTWTADSSPANILDAVAFRAMIAMHSPDNAHGLYWHAAAVHGSTKIFSLRTNRNHLYKQADNEPGITDDAREGLKYCWHKFNANRMRFSRLRKRALDDNNRVVPARHSDDPELKFAPFKPFHTFIIEAFGKMWSAVEVKEMLAKEHNVKVSVPLLKKFAAFHSDVIAERVTRHKDSIEDIRLGYKRSRLEELAWLYKNLKEDFNDPKTTKVRRTAFAKEMRGTIAQIKEEVDGNVVTVNGTLDLNHAIQTQIAVELLDRETLRQVVVARVAAALGAEPTVLIAEMARSDYSQYNNYLEGGAAADVLPQDALKPEDFDFDAISEKADRNAEVASDKTERIRQQREALVEKIKQAGIREQLASRVTAARQVLEDERNELN